MNKLLRANTASSLQKTYDETYILCSTAIYFEGQNNEEEALRSWRVALDRITYLSAHRIPSNYQPKNASERNVYESLRRLEAQCQERIDILESLRRSRISAFSSPAQPPFPPYPQGTPVRPPPPPGYYSHSPTTPRGGGYAGKAPRPTGPPLPPRQFYGYDPHGAPVYHSPAPPAFSRGGILAPMNYSDLARPEPSQSLLPTARRSSQEFQRSNGATGPSMRASRVAPPENGMYYNDNKPLLTTLRSNGEGKRNGHGHGDSSRKSSRPVAASRAAGLAWSSISSKLTGSTPRQGNMPEATKPRPTDKRETNELKHLSADYARHARAPYLSEVNAANTGNGHGYDRSQGSAAADAAMLASSRRRSPGADGTRPRGTKTPEPLIDLSGSPPPSSAHSSIHRYVASPASSQYASDRQQQSPARDSQPARAPHAPSERQRVLRRPVKPQHLQGWSPSESPVRKPISQPRSTASMVSAASKAAKLANVVDEDVRMQTPPLPQEMEAQDSSADDFRKKSEEVLKNLPAGIDPAAAKQILNDIVIHGDEVHWEDVSGLETAKLALKEAVVYPFLRPDLFSGLREPARGMLLFGPPGTGKTMLARAVATESHSTFFSVGASSLTSKWHGESEKLVKALFGLAKVFAPSIIFVDEIDAILSARASQGEHEVSRRTKTEFLVQWSDLQKAAAGREPSESTVGDASRVLVLAATNIPWDIDEAARRRFVRRQYIPLPEAHVRKTQLERLLGHQKHNISEQQLEQLVELTDGFSGSDITALAKDAAMGPLRNLGEALLHTPMDQIRPISFDDFEASLLSIRPSVSQSGLQAYEDWAKEFGERGG